ncbi:Xaa-Pro peptidase family protein [Halobacteria archaeon AArc-m2/3/4]|uniref:Xaa-Pro peptidase family protein n=1 Tax=Natronoglomus mannanivorans TaxID=2979990 RepID=A0ABT2QGS5_9EURY|nr:Xaa-Pro peptidase family protein [Halobacteria archaeon AArc-m2/3/4]
MALDDRLTTLQHHLRKRGYDAALLYPGPNLFYWTGFYGEPLDRHLLFVVPAEGEREPWFVTPRKSLDQIRENARVQRTDVVDANDPEAVAIRVAESFDTDDPTIALDDRMPFGVVQPLRQHIDDGTFESVSPITTELRIRKDRGEIDALRRSATIADEVSEAIRSLGEEAVGMTEAELAAVIRAHLHRKGGTRLSFDIVVASGPNAARPYYRHGNRTIDAGDPVILDFGTFFDGYASDQTRTVVFSGDPPPSFEAAYDAVLDAFEAGVDAVEPGRLVETIDHIVESTIGEHGFAAQLVHATGHGVGVEAHEPPSVEDGNRRTLEPGMVFSIEPGLYVEGEFGVRLEDLVVVTDEGCERLNRSPKGWRPL